MFLVLKDRLLNCRSDWKSGTRAFPAMEVHRKLRKALEVELGDSHSLVHDLKTLLRERKKADYLWSVHFDCRSAFSSVDVAWDAIEKTENLSSQEVQGVANELFHLDMR